MKLDQEKIKRWLPILAVVLGVTASFLYGWYIDDSKPRAGTGWADQGLYTTVTDRLAHTMLPTPGQLHFSIGYSTLGIVGKFFFANDPFVLVSFSLLMASAVFCFLAVKHLFGTLWSLAFCALLFYWDGAARSFHYSADLFAVPWNNQVLFFAMAFFFWLLITRSQKSASRLLLIVLGLITGLCLITREESILFTLPLATGFLWLTKSNWKQYLLVGGIVGLCFLPQAAVKASVLGSLAESGHDTGYSQTAGKYFQPRNLYRNTWETLIDSKHFNEPQATRGALLKAAPWLWLSPIGLGFILFTKRYGGGLKLFTIVSCFLIIFYLSGSNMSAQKLQFHCLRYISPGFITLNFAVLVVANEIWTRSRQIQTEGVLLKGELNKSRKKQNK